MQSRQVLFGGRPIKVMTLNAENFYRTKDGYLCKSPESVQALADVILREDADIIALQEVQDRGILASFNKNYLGGRYPHIAHIPVAISDKGRQLAVMSKPHIQLQATSHWTEQNQGRRNPDKRDLLEVEATTDNGYRFRLFNAHFRSANKYGKGEAETLPVRLQEAESAAGIIERVLETQPGAHVLVLGDLNSRSDTSNGQAVLKVLSRANGPNRYRLHDVLDAYQKEHPETRLASSSDAIGSRVDYVLASPAMMAGLRSAELCGEPQQLPWSLASNHRPLVAVFEEPDDPSPAETPPSRRLDRTG